MFLQHRAPLAVVAEEEATTTREPFGGFDRSPVRKAASHGGFRTSASPVFRPAPRTAGPGDVASAERRSGEADDLPPDFREKDSFFSFLPAGRSWLPDFSKLLQAKHAFFAPLPSDDEDCDLDGGNSEFNNPSTKPHNSFRKIMETLNTPAGAVPSRRRRHSVDGRGSSEKLFVKIKAETHALLSGYRELKPLADRHWHAHAAIASGGSGSATGAPSPAAPVPLDSLQLGTFKLELKKLLQSCQALQELIQVLEPSQNLRRWTESHIQLLNQMQKRFNGGEGAAAFSVEQSQLLLGQSSLDGMAFDVRLKDRQGVDAVLNKGADPMVCDAFFKTCAHDLAAIGQLPFHTDTWHAVRLQSLKKRGADLRSSPDGYGRAPVLIALEEHNVSFLRGILKVENGEEWSMRVFRKVPPFIENGTLMKKTLATQQLVKQIMPLKLKEYARVREEKQLLQEKKMFAELENEAGSPDPGGKRSTPGSPDVGGKDGSNSPGGSPAARKGRRGTVAMAKSPVSVTSPGAEKKDPKQLYMDELRVYMLELMPKLFPRAIQRSFAPHGLFAFSLYHRAVLEGDFESILCHLAIRDADLGTLSLMRHPSDELYHLCMHQLLEVAGRMNLIGSQTAVNNAKTVAGAQHGNQMQLHLGNPPMQLPPTSGRAVALNMDRSTAAAFPNASPPLNQQGNAVFARFPELHEILRTLIEAVEEENFDLVLEFVKELSYVATETPLHVAVAEQNVEMVQLLVKVGANVEFTANPLPILYCYAQERYKGLLEAWRMREEVGEILGVGGSTYGATATNSTMARLSKRISSSDGGSSKNLLDGKRDSSSQKKSPRATAAIGSQNLNRNPVPSYSSPGMLNSPRGGGDTADATNTDPASAATKHPNVPQHKEAPTLLTTNIGTGGAAGSPSAPGIGGGKESADPAARCGTSSTKSSGTGDQLRGSCIHLIPDAFNGEVLDLHLLRFPPSFFLQHEKRAVKQEIMVLLSCQTNTNSAANHSSGGGRLAGSKQKTTSRENMLSMSIGTYNSGAGGGSCGTSGGPLLPGGNASAQFQIQVGGFHHMTTRTSSKQTNAAAKKLPEIQMSYSEPILIGWDAVYAVAELLESEQFGTLENLCDWYKSLGPTPYQRVARFWLLYQEKHAGGGAVVAKQSNKPVVSAVASGPQGGFTSADAASKTPSTSTHNAGKSGSAANAVVSSTATSTSAKGTAMSAASSTKPASQSVKVVTASGTKSSDTLGASVGKVSAAGTASGELSASANAAPPVQNQSKGAAVLLLPGTVMDTDDRATVHLDADAEQQLSIAHVATGRETMCVPASAGESGNSRRSEPAGDQAEAPIEEGYLSAGEQATT